jgi:stearoyl-CoA desaturase (delta-9 desaturase)
LNIITGLAAWTALLVHWSWHFAAFVVVLSALLIFGVSAGYHRYFSHRAFTLDRVSQFLLALLAMGTNEGGVLTWAQVHERHHRYTDTEEDPHSPVIKGKLWALGGWTFAPMPPPCSTRPSYFAQFPELRFVDRWPQLASMAIAVPAALYGWASGIGAWPALAGLMLAKALCLHCTNLLNLWGHSWGRRRFDLRNNSRNSFVLALITMGDGWHNNHHWYPASCRFGIAWYEIDLSYLLLRVLSWFGIVKNMRTFPATILARDAGRMRAPSAAAGDAVPR